MNKKIIFSALLILLLVFAACSNDTNEEQENTEEIERETTEEIERETTNQYTENEEFETLMKAIESGRQTICTVQFEDEETGEMANVKYHIEGQNIRVETQLAGMEQLVIFKDNTIYTKVNEDYMMDGCDWLKIGDDEDADDDYDFFDYDEYEDTTRYTVECRQESFSRNKFDASGNVCDMKELFGDMFGDYDFEYDFEDDYY